MNEPGMNGQYTGRGGIEPIKFITSNSMNFLEGCIIKYVYRYPFKNGVEDLEKAKQYLEWLIASLQIFDKENQDERKLMDEWSESMGVRYEK